MNKDYFDEISDRQLGLDKLNAKLGGVCAGVAHHLEVPRAFVRGAAIIALLQRRATINFDIQRGIN